MVADDKRGIAVDFQTLAEPTNIAAGIARGEGRCPDPVPGHVMDNIGELAYVDQDLPRDFSACGPCMAGDKIF